MRLRISIMLLWAVGMCFHLVGQNAPTSKSFTLAEAQKFALTHNAESVNADLEKDKSWETYREYRAAGLPQVNASVDYTHFLKLPTTILPNEFGIDPSTGQVSPDFDPEVQFGTKNNVSAKIEASQLIFSGTYLIGLKAASTYFDLAEAQERQVHSDLKFNIANAYFGALVAQENLSILEKSKSSLDKILFETNELYKNGFVEEIEVDRLRLSVSNLETQMESIKRQYEVAKDAVKLLIGLNSKVELELSDELSDFTAQDVDTDALDPSIVSRPEFRLLQVQEKFRDFDIKQIKSRYLPQLIGFGSYQYDFQSNGFGLFKEAWFPTSTLGLSLQIPIFDGLGRSAQLQQRKIMMQQVRNNQKAFEKVFSFEVDRAKSEYISALQKVNSQKDNMELAQKIYDVASIKYKEGVGSSLEVISADSGLSETQQLYISALYELVLAKSNLDKALGKH